VHYDELIQQLPDEERYPFTMALAELNIGPRTGHIEAELAVAEFLESSGVRKVMASHTGLNSHLLEEKLVHAAMHKDAQWWNKVKDKVKNWWDSGPEDEYEEEYGEPFPMTEPGTDELYSSEPEEVIGPYDDPPAPINLFPENRLPVEEPSLVDPVPNPDLSMEPTFGDSDDLPEMHPVDSSNLEAAGYDDEEGIMYILFKAKRNTPRTLYRYTDVSRHEFDGMLTAESVGKYFHQVFRNTKPYTGPLNPDVYGL